MTILKPKQKTKKTLQSLCTFIIPLGYDITNLEATVKLGGFDDWCSSSILAAYILLTKSLKWLFYSEITSASSSFRDGLPHYKRTIFSSELEQ